jgi:DNA-directed RNA polymerase specialized sigma24 family protein
MPKESAVKDAIAEKLELVVRLLAYLVAAEHDNLQDRAVTLTSLGLSPKEIARVCNTTPNTVSVRLVEAKKKVRKRRPAARRKGKR